MKKILKIGGLGLLLAYFPVMLAFVSFDKHNTLCRDIASEINDSVANRFITSEEVRDIVLEKYPDILGTPLDDINTDEMEHFFEKYSAIENCEVYYSVSGVLHVDITQKKPLLRVFDKKGSYYLDKKGNKMPLSSSYTAHVLVANGYIERLKDKKDLFELAVFINSDPFWRSQIEQIYVDRKGEFNLIPRVGDHTFYFFCLSRLAPPFRPLKALYVDGWNAREWNLYKKVSLKYNGQVVCSK
jgi:cell division protein FtsQ